MKSNVTIALLWLLSLGATFLGTKYWLEKKQTAPQVESTKGVASAKLINADSSCMLEYFEGFPYDYDAITQAKWLESNFDSNLPIEACNCVREEHRIKGGKGDYDTYVAASWGAATPVVTPIPIKEIKDLYFNRLINYDFYISFKYDEVNKKVVPQLANDYSESVTCYSIPLFESIYRANKNAILEFTKAAINGKPSIIFEVKGTSDAYFDYSQIPTLYGDIELKMAF